MKVAMRELGEKYMHAPTKIFKYSNRAAKQSRDP